MRPGSRPRSRICASSSELLEARRQIGLIGPGQVAVDASEMERGLSRDGLEQRQRVFPRNAGSAHPGIDCDVDVQRLREIPGRSGQQGHLPGVKNGRGELEADGGLGFPSVEDSAQDQDGFADTRVAEFGPLGDGGHCKPAATRLDEGLRHPDCPVSVRVRLDDGHQLARFGASPGLGKIDPNRPEVDRRSRRPPAHSRSPLVPERDPTEGLRDVASESGGFASVPAYRIHNASNAAGKSGVRFDTPSASSSFRSDEADGYRAQTTTPTACQSARQR